MADHTRPTRMVAASTLALGAALLLAACANGASTPTGSALDHRVGATSPTTTSPSDAAPSGSTTTTLPSSPAETGQPTPAVSASTKSSSSTMPTTVPSTTKIIAALPSTSPATAPPVGTPTPTTIAAAPNSVTIDSTNTDLGTVLTNNLGFTLYLLTADSPTRSNCTSFLCTSVWPPVLASGGGTAGTGVQQSMLGTLHLANGTVQVTYGGHPLYTYLGDRKPGQTTGQGVSSFGGVWYVLSAATGQAITAP
jgi:predicted lipoprotein with Yx(FWY)xxD motif